MDTSNWKHWLFAVILFGVPLLLTLVNALVKVVRAARNLSNPPRQHYANFSHTCGKCGRSNMAYNAWDDTWECCGQKMKVLR